MKTLTVFLLATVLINLVNGLCYFPCFDDLGCKYSGLCDVCLKNDAVPFCWYKSELIIEDFCSDVTEDYEMLRDLSMNLTETNRDHYSKILQLYTEKC